MSERDCHADLFGEEPLQSFTFFSLSGGCVAEMLDQAAAQCGTFVTSHGCPDADGELHTGGERKRVCRHGSPANRDKRCGSAWCRADREREGRIASVSVVVQLVKDTTRYSDEFTRRSTLRAEMRCAAG